MERSFKRVRVVVVQPDEEIYFDRYYLNPLEAMDKFNYFCKLARINYPHEIDFAMNRTALYNEMTAYFPFITRLIHLINLDLFKSRCILK